MKGVTDVKILKEESTAGGATLTSRAFAQPTERRAP
jgi:hypothetical protein